jgi:hypothetical protein
MFQYYNWEEVNINWEDLDLNWEEVGILINDVLPKVVAFPPLSGEKVGSRWYDLKALNKLPEDKKRKIIKIACLIEGKEYIEYKYKNTEDVSIGVKHIDIILDKILNNIKVHVQNIS